LFFMSHPGHARNFESVLRELAERGHDVHVAVDRVRKKNLPGSSRPLEMLAADHPGLTWGSIPTREKAEWGEVGVRYRAALDYLRFLDPELGQPDKVRDRAGRHVPAQVRRFTSSRVGRSPAALNAMRDALRAAERAVPVGRNVRGYLKSQAPDVVLVTPLVELGSQQVEYLRAARALQVPSALLVASWDNLTMKGLIHEVPDMVAVWNAIQQREAVELHGIPSDRIAVTGAFPYDHWFDWAPSRSRDDYCSDVGLDPARPYLLYVGSSEFIARDEAGFVLDWTRSVLQRNGDLDGAQVLVRPHPTNPFVDEEIRRRLEALPGVSVVGVRTANPSDQQARRAYYDSIFHSAAVVGVNTSALIESAIIGRPVHTILSARYEDSQLGLRHFNYLVEENGGMVRVAESFDQHAEQLAASMAESGRSSKRNRRFIESFIRPFGLAEPATPRLVAAVERLGEETVAHDRDRGAGVGRSVAGRVLAVGGRSLIRRRLRRDRAEKHLVEAEPVSKVTKRRAAAQPENGDAPRSGPANDRVEAEPVAKATKRKAGARPEKGDQPNAGPTKAERLVRKQTAAREMHAAVADVRPRRRAAELGAPPSVAEHEERLTGPLRLLHGEIDRLARRENPIILGPFLAEVGFELLYWVPMLRWAVDEFPELRGRLIGVSRGGTEGWLDDVAATYIDVLDLYSPAELGARRASLKQRTISPFELEIYQRVKGATGLPFADVLHPALLFTFYYRAIKADNAAFSAGVWSSETAQRGYGARYDRLSAVDEDNVLAQLPRDYVAMRFYFRPSFPDTPENRAFAAEMIRAVSREVPVVLLNNRLELDDHYDFEADQGEGVFTVHEHMTPGRNLAVQTAVAGNARAFMGTYGGLAYLAPFLGVPSLSFSSDSRLVHGRHHHLASAVFQPPGWGRFASLDVADVPLDDIRRNGFDLTVLDDLG